MFEPNPVSFEELLKILTFEKKSDLEKYCRTLNITQTDFVTLIMACEAGALPFYHRIHYRDYVPEHLKATDKERKALSINGVGPLKGDAAKMVSKIMQTFKERRYLVGHIFHTPSLDRWHFFYFDQRDIDEQGANHWKEGAHVHFINWLWPSYDAQSLWSEFTGGNIKLKNSLHIRWTSYRKAVANKT